MAVTNYHTVNGEIVGETTSGVRTDYLVDALGSVTGTVNQSAQVLNRYRYKPYGALLAKTGTAADPKSQWVGTLGYRATSRAQSDYYVRARHYGPAPGRWTTMASPYTYVGNGPTTGQGQPDASVGDLLGIVAGLAQCPGAVGSCKGTTYQGCKKGPLPPGGFKSSLNAKIAELLAMYCRGNPLPGTGIEPMPKTGNCPLITAGTVKCWIWAESQGSAQEIDPENEYGQYPTGLLQFGCASGTCHSVTASDLGCDSEWVPLPGGGCRRVSDFDLLDENDNLTLAIWALCNCQYKGQIGRNWPKKFIPNTGMQRWGTKTTPNSAFCCCMCGFRSNIEHGGKDWHDYWG